MPRRFPFHLLGRLPPAGDHVPDAELLRRFVRDRDPVALELVVRRHADAVWAACRRVSRSAADAEDAFQATFLVLARKAGGVRGACAGGWLHRVAVNAALKLKASGGRQPPDRFPHQGADAPRSPEEQVESDELAAVVQEELARLPERYRLPVVLCDLEGQTHAEAAKVLRWPVGSVSGRLSRARGLLRDRLARRGYGAAPLLLAPAGGLPPRLIPTTTAALSGAAPVPPPVALVAEGVLTAMRTAKLQLTAAVVASAGLLGLAGVGTYTVLAQDKGPPTAGKQPDGPPKAEPPVEGDWTPEKTQDSVPTAFPDVKPIEVEKFRDPAVYDAYPRLFGRQPVTVVAADDTGRRLLKARLRQGQLEMFVRQARQMVGQVSADEYYGQIGCLNDMRAAAGELWAREPAALVPWLEEFVRYAKQVERITEARTSAGADPPQSLNAARRYRLETEAALWKAKNPKAGAGGGPAK
ncbi:MAG: sigma-70 family RNA polymerase sigma factor [Gemmataceae bacterium]|nr:sigma-70 family RNA polymerase sigma factor [Gemmataceae bacterium]